MHSKLALPLALCLVLGNVVGSGIYILPTTLAQYGSISIVAWGVTASGALALAWVFARLNQRFPASGGPYVYAREAFGPFAGFTIAYSYWVGLWVTNAAIVMSSVNYLGVLFPALDEQSVQYAPAVALAVKVAFVWLFTAVNLLGVRTAGVLELFLTVLKMAPLLCIAIVACFHWDSANFFPLNQSGQSHSMAIVQAAALCLWAFMGLETATIPAEEVQDSRTVYRATLYGTLMAALVYIFCTVALFGFMPAADLQRSPYPFSEAALRLFGPAMAYFTGVCAAVAALGALNVSILLQGQIPWVAARDGCFPRIFSYQNRHRAPVWGLILSSVCITGLLGMTWRDSLLEQFTRVSLLATFASLLTYAVTACAELLYLWREGVGQRTRGTWVAVLARVAIWGTALVALIYALAMFVGLGWTPVRDGLLFLGLAPILYALNRRFVR